MEPWVHRKVGDYIDDDDDDDDDDDNDDENSFDDKNNENRRGSFAFYVSYSKGKHKKLSSYLEVSFLDS